MNDIEIRRTPEIIGSEIRNLTSAAKYMTLWYGIEIGRRLAEAKELTKHGEWLTFLENETEFSQPTASRYIKLFEEYGAENLSIFGDNSKYSTLNNLSVTNALRLLAVPEEERESFALEVDAEHISSKELEEAIKARESAEAQMEKLRSDLQLEKDSNEHAKEMIDELKEDKDKLFEKLVGAEKRIKEIESRPVEVAVQEPSSEEINKAIKNALDEAEIKHKAEIEKFRKAAEKEKTAADKLKTEAKTKNEEYAQKLKEAEDKLRDAGAADAAETKRLSEEVKKLEKQLKMSGSEMAVFKLRFGEWQSDYNAMMQALNDLPAEQRENCEKAIEAQIEVWNHGGNKA